MMRRQMAPVLLAAVVSLGGCASRTWTLEGVGADGTLGREVRYVLESPAGNEGSVAVVARARSHDQVQGRTTDTVRLWVTLDNASPDPIVLPTQSLRVRDDQGRELTLLSVAAPGEGPLSEVVVPPHHRSTVELFYDLGGPRVLPATGSLTLDWSYRFRGQETQHTTRFIPVRYHPAPATYNVGFGFHYWPGYWYGGFSRCW